MFVGDTGCPDSLGNVPAVVAQGVARVGGNITIGVSGTLPGLGVTALGIQAGPPIPIFRCRPLIFPACRRRSSRSSPNGLMRD